MFNKTLRSVLSLVLVFGLMLGVSGNAIALAISNPAENVLDKVDTQVYGTIDELNALIDDLEDQIDTLEFTTLPDAEAKLADAAEKLLKAESELAKLTAADGDVTVANNKLADAKAKLAEAKAMLEGEKLAELRQTAYDKAWKQFTDLVADKEAQAWAEFEAAVGLEYETQSNTLKQTLADAKDALNLKIAEEKAKLDAELAAKKAELDAKLALAGANQAAIDAAYAEYKAAAAEAKAAAAQAEADAWDAYADKEAKAWETFNNEAAGAAADARAEVAAKIEQAKIEAKAKFELKFEEEFETKLEEVADQVALAEAALVDVEAYVGKVNETVAYYQGVIVDAKAILEDANDLVKDVETAIAEARETIAQARVLVNNLEKTYNDLRGAVTDPQPSVSFVKETVAELEANYNAVWNALLDLDAEIDELIAAYDALSEYEIGEIDVHRDSIPGFTVGPFQVDVDTDGDGVDETYGIGLTELPTVDLSGYDFYFAGVEIPEKPEMLNKLDTTLDNVIAKVTTLNAEMAYYVAAAKPYIAEALDVTEEALGITYDVLKNNLNKEGAKKVYNWLYNNPDKVCNLVKEFGVYGLDLLVKYGPYALDLLEKHSDLAVLGMKLTAGGVYLTVTLGAGVLGYVGDKLDFLADYDDEVVAAARKLYAKYGDEAKALIEVYVDYLDLRERYYNATHADYTIFHDSLFVAIGDSATAVSGGYVDQLAELLEIPHMTENLGALDLTVEEAIALVKDNAELIGKADLITLNFTNIAASTEMLDALAQEYGNDFTTQVNGTISNATAKALAALKESMIAYGIGENHVDLVDRAGELVDLALAELNERLIAEGMDEATVNMVQTAAEAYAIAYITRAAWYPALVSAVHEINPDAQIVIVGTYNDLEGVVVEVGNREIEIGELTKCLIAVANLENLAQAFIGGEAIYVHASAVETVFETNDYEDLNALGYLMSILNDEMLPSEAGHAYIAEEIYEALNVEYKIWGDVNGDRKVNCRDARLILQYTAGLITEDDLDLTWADVNGDGKVNSRDARLILQLRAGQIEHFPVCNLSEE